MNVLIYQSVNRAVLSQIPAGVRTVLDIGCGGGVFGAAVKAMHDCAVVGVTYSQAEAEQARLCLDRVEVLNLNDGALPALGRFDCIVCSHVLEHLIFPQQLLSNLRVCLNPGGLLVVALPNALHWKQRWEFLRGRFQYTDGGVMDRTHLRFFDWQTAGELLRESGFAPVQRLADGGFPWSSRLGVRLSGVVDRRALRGFPGLFAAQFVFSCTVAPAPQTAPPLAVRPTALSATTS